MVCLQGMLGAAVFDTSDSLSATLLVLSASLIASVWFSFSVCLEYTASKQLPATKQPFLLGNPVAFSSQTSSPSPIVPLRYRKTFTIFMFELKKTHVPLSRVYKWHYGNKEGGPCSLYIIFMTRYSCSDLTLVSQLKVWGCFPRQLASFLLP